MGNGRGKLTTHVDVDLRPVQLAGNTLYGQGNGLEWWKEIAGDLWKKDKFGVRKCQDKPSYILRNSINEQPGTHTPYHPQF